MHAGRQQISTQSQHYQQNGPNGHLLCEKLSYLELEKEVVWFTYNHTISVPDQEDVFRCYVHIGENPKKKKSARVAD